MAKKNTVQIDVLVNGEMRKVSVDAAKLGMQLDNVGKSAHTADRNLKGAAQASANGTKNFSKMSQGVGGLVGVYATLAATAFAVSAAFEFFKKVADFRVLQDSQVAYASSTGTALKTLSNDIRAATDGMLEFQEASRAAAIGVASGLTPKQLTDLAEGASAVSKILGRDVSDSFDRLVRGVTKAEPELLDELGITLRLEDAKRKFALQVGKTAKTLSLLEQKQAVNLEVQTQLEEKFISTSKAIKIEDNAVKKLGVAFSDVFNSISTFLSGPVEGIANFLSENIASFIAVMALFATSVISTMLPSLDKFVNGVQESADEASDALKKAKDDLDELKESSGGAATVQTALKDVKAEKGSGIDRLRNQEKLSKRQAATLLRFAKEEKGVYRQLTMYQKQVYKKALRDILGEKDKFTSKVKRSFYRLGDELAIVAKRIERRWKQAMAAMTKAAAGATKRIVGGFRKLMGLITGITIAVQILVEGLRKIPGMGDFLKADPALVKITGRIEAITESLRTMSTEFGKSQEAVSKHLEAVNKGSEQSFRKTMTSLKTVTGFGTNAIPKLVELANVLFDLQQVKAANRIEDGAAKSATNEFIGTFFQGLGLDATKAIESAQELASELANTLMVSSIPAAKAIFALSEELKKLDGASTDLDGLFTATMSITHLGEEFALQNQNIVALNESLKASRDAFEQLVQSNASYKTSVTDLLEITYDEIEATAFQTVQLGNLVEMTKDYKTEIKDLLIQRLAYLNLVKESETKSEQDKVKNEIAYNNALRYATPLLREQAESVKQLADMKADINKKTADLAILEARNDEGDKDRIDTLHAQLGLMIMQREELERQQDVMVQLGQAGMDGLERGMSSQISALLKGEEKSGKDAILNMIKGAAEGMADELANQLTESAMGGLRDLFGMGKKSPEDLMKEAIKLGADYAADKWTTSLAQAGAEFELKRAQAANKDVKTRELDKELDTSSADPLKSFAIKMQSYFGATGLIVEVSKGTPVTQTGPGTQEPTGVELLVTDGIPQSSTEEKIQRVNNDNLSTLNDSTTDSSSATDKNTVATDNLGVTMKQVGQQFASSLGMLMAAAGGGGTKSLVLGIIGQVAGQAVNNYMASGSVTSSSPPKPKVEGRYGGIFQEYATGGIARGRQAGYPAILHGTEAVVPLPNGKQIPVEMKGGGGQQNNISVNVNVDNNGQATTTMEGADGENLGKAIAGAVQQELLNQKRAGGILSPYGVS